MKLRTLATLIPRKGADTVSSLLADSFTTGLRSCAMRINACFEKTSQLDSCVAGSPRCVSSTPWKNDPSGEDCCPESCLLDYFNKRTTMSDGAALASMVRGVCYPGMQSLLDGAQP